MTPLDMDWPWQVIYWVGCVTTGMKLGDIAFWVFKKAKGIE